jgi:hypothetical protein
MEFALQSRNYEIDILYYIYTGMRSYEETPFKTNEALCPVHSGPRVSNYRLLLVA